jgi:hypothetical protein
MLRNIVVMHRNIAVMHRNIGDMLKHNSNILGHNSTFFAAMQGWLLGSGVVYIDQKQIQIK